MNNCQADESKGDVNNQFLRESLGSLTKGFTVVAKDRTPVSDPSSKKLAIFAVTNVLFKVYFKVNTLQLCGKLINVVEGPGGIMDNLRLFPVSDVVMYKYYIGRLKMFEDKYEEARYDSDSYPRYVIMERVEFFQIYFTCFFFVCLRDCLRFALRFCPKSCLRNRQRILASLVPIEVGNYFNLFNREGPRDFNSADCDKKQKAFNAFYLLLLMHIRNLY